ncbi:MAG: ATP-dependent DNA helicase RecG [Clostridia bacterium]|nr:ATP-dependent DNA helicase RecG [Clostridia bacterium]
MELKDIKGIGKKREDVLREAGIETPQDLLRHFPKKYYDFSKPDIFGEDNKYKLLLVKIVQNPKMFKAKGTSFITAKAQDSSGQEINLYWFGQTYVKSTLKIGSEIYVYGKNSPRKKNTFNVVLHKFKENFKTGIFPVYKTFDGVGQAVVKSGIKDVLEHKPIFSIIPEDIEAENGLISLGKAFEYVHFPETFESIEAGHERIAIEDGVIIAHINKVRKISAKEKREFVYKDIDACVDEFRRLIPYTLTSGQKNAIEDIAGDLSSGTTANRLIEGDVGSGKTLVAFCAMYIAMKNGGQSVLMAPTEILANQHYELWTKLFGADSCVILCSSQSANQRREAVDRIANGKAMVVFGTQAVLSDKIEFSNLQLVITDEQHKFGVSERAKLAGGKAVDYISLSATPIPRTVSLVVYGNLDLTQIKERPHALDIQTNIVLPSKIEQMWNFIENEINEDKTCYIVCPKIDDDEEKDEIISTQKMTKELKRRFGQDVVAELNGKMKDEAKDKILKDFNAGKVRLLVSTTVVEVGVDSKNASIMIIMSPERFGLASLHQLRGRVGRAGQKAYCFCVVSNDINEKQYERLAFFKNNQNGFDIAEFDLKTRGAGDMLGTRQHGISSGQIMSLAVYEKAQKIYEDIEKSGKKLKVITEIAENKFSKLLEDIVMN